MQAFSCDRCGQLVFFENSACLRCGAELGFFPEERAIRSLEDPDGRTWKVNGLDNRRFQRCARAEIAACNWMVAACSNQAYLCESCELTQSEPPRDENLAQAFAAAEMAKRRLLSQLRELGMSFTSRREDGERGLAFVLEAESPGNPVTTGHAHGVITLNLAEADSVHREQVRLSLGEPYRTLLGHFRHEIGHYYWTRLVEFTPHLQEFRRLFGDETRDYECALQAHYSRSAESRWQDAYVSAYASVHPWEDWAETFAHYLHIRDVLATGAAFGVRVTGPAHTVGATGQKLTSRPNVSATCTFQDLLEEWLPLTYALNAISRSMGRRDLYPFVLPPPAIKKLAFVHDLALR